jgi:cell division septation protein DedD
MLKKILFILAVCLLVMSCNKKDDKANKPVSMQDVSREMGFEPDDADLESDYTGRNLADPPITETHRETPRSTPQSSNRSSQSVARESGDFTAQLLAAKDRSRVEVLSRKLNNAGYDTVVQEAIVNGEKMYRLRLAGSFSRAYAEYLAKEIQSKFPEFRDYWITRH